MRYSESVEKFKAIAKKPKFQGWPMKGEYKFGEKIPHFGQTISYTLLTPNGPEEYTSILRQQGWAVVFGVTHDDKVLTLVQWKPGVNRASWELPPGGIGPTNPSATQEELLKTVQAAYLKETGFGGGWWVKLGISAIETGKFRGYEPGDKGFNAHLYLAFDLAKQPVLRGPQRNEIMEVLPVPINEFREILRSDLFTEASAQVCAWMALDYLNQNT